MRANMKYTSIVVVALLSLVLVIPSSGMTLQNSEIIPSSGIISNPLTRVREILTAFQNGPGSEVTEEAKRYDLISFRGGYEYVKSAKQANPNLIAIVYYNIPRVWDGGWLIDEATGKTGYQVAKENGWILKDTYGQEIREGSFVMVDIGNKGYQNWLADWVKYKMDKYRCDGVMGDNFDATFLYYRTKPVNPRTGKLYTYEEWANDLVQMANAIKSRGALLIGNGGAGGHGAGKIGYWSEFRPLHDKVFSQMDGVVIEGILRWDNQLLRSESEWVQDLEHFKYLTSIAPNKHVVAWGITDNPPSGTTTEQLAWYMLAMYLLGRSSANSYFCASSAMSWWNGWQIDVGEPLEEYHKRTDSSIYQRKYSKALVLANPTESSFTITLDKTYETVEGKTIGSSITVEPHMGVILFAS